MDGVKEIEIKKEMNEESNQNEIKELNEIKDEASIPLSILTNLLTCSICRDLMDNTHVGITCMHRFCGPCIEKYITCTQATDRSCPFCRCRIASRRQFKPEPFCQNIIETVFSLVPTSKQKFQLSEYQDLHRTRKAKIFEDSKDAAKRIVIPEDVYETPVMKKTRSHPKHEADDISGEDDMVNLGLRYYVLGPNSMRQSQTLERPYISAPPECTILDLKKYLFSQLPETAFLSLQSINLWFKTGNKMSRLSDSITLQKICIELWDRHSDFILEYSITPPASPDEISIPLHSLSS